MGIYLVSYQHLPYVRAAEILSDWTGAEVSVGSLQAFVAEGADGLEEFLKEVRRALELSFRTSRASFLPPSLGVLCGSDRERFEFAHELV